MLGQCIRPHRVGARAGFTQEGGCSPSCRFTWILSELTWAGPWSLKLLGKRTEMFGDLALSFLLLLVGPKE